VLNGGSHQLSEDCSNVVVFEYGNDGVCNLILLEGDRRAFPPSHCSCSLLRMDRLAPDRLASLTVPGPRAAFFQETNGGFKLS
jgi:hypothetical protein